MKIEPIFNFLKEHDSIPCEMRIGYRPNEKERAENMLARANEDGFEYFKTVIGKRKTQNKWGSVPYRKAKFPLIDENITKDVIYNYWNDKPVRFAYRNNCVACVNRNPLMISHMASKDIDKVKWFQSQELKTGNTFLSDASMSSILKFNLQGNLFDDNDFSSCDSGYCGL